VTRRLFVTGTGTGVGKTWLTRGLSGALVARGLGVVALKPVETGCDPTAADARDLAAACHHPELADAPGLYRARLPLAPLAATLEGEAAPDLEHIVAACRALLGDGVGLVEGAGGLLVPLDAEHTMADLAVALAIPVVLVATDGLGALSHALCALEAARARGLEVRAIVLTEAAATDDPSRRTNRAILSGRSACPVLAFGRCAEAELARTADPLLAPLGLL
jgi:dethiobiotin synthetase